MQHLIDFPIWVKKYSRQLLYITVLLLSLLMFLPWQQTILGMGRVTAFDPTMRPQIVKAPMKAQIKAYNIHEGQYVQAGELLIELRDLEKDFLSSSALSQTEQSLSALQATQYSYIAKSSQLSNALSQNQSGMMAELKQAEQRISIAQNDLQTAKLNYDRINTLTNKGLSSERDKELAIQGYKNAEQNLQASRNRLYEVKSKNQSELSKNSSDIAGTMAEAQKIADSIAKTKLYADTIKVRRDITQIRAPYSGWITRIMRYGTGEIVSEGNDLFLLVPDTNDQAVELFLQPYDAALVSIGDKVALEFSGWPSIQFTSINIPHNSNIYHGIVRVIDRVDYDNGLFRILVEPDKAKPPWPNAKYLRNGNQVIGWVMLRQVPLIYEVWRRFNGFKLSVPEVKRYEYAKSLKEDLDTKSSRTQLKYIIK